MKNSLITLYPGSYSNYDAYDNVLAYVLKKKYPCGYAIPIPIENNSIISAFRYIEENSNYQVERYIWHFTISLPETSDLTKFMSVADNIAMLFGYNYQVIYSLDVEKRHPHIHFAVNNYSYHSEVPPLSDNQFESYINQGLDILKGYYPQYQAKFILAEENYV